MGSRVQREQEVERAVRDEDGAKRPVGDKDDVSQPACVWLEDVVDGMQMQSDESTAYLDRRSGEVIVINDDEAELAEDDTAAEEWGPPPDWQAAELPRIRELLESDDCLPLPSRFEIHEWRIMDDFSRQLEDGDVREALLDAIHGAGAFRRFRDAIHRYGVAESWYRFRDATLEEIAVDWLEANGIPYRRGRYAASGEEGAADAPPLP